MLLAFQLFGFSHLGVLALLFVIAYLLIRRCRKEPHASRTHAVLALLAFLCFASYPMSQAALAAVDDSYQLDSHLPFHLCDVAAIICGFALTTRKPLLCELAYFWGLAGTLQGLLTPNLGHDFPSPIFITFFLMHGVIVITALLLPLGLGWRPREGAVRRVFLGVLVYAAFAFAINALLDTNFGFLMHKPEQASLLDVMGAWPWYVICLIVVAGILFYLLSLPFKRSNESALKN
ncbi:TIGR02206 family membrane protein [Verrucomicrobiaceae bacterium 5K15]|uniref:TIGR02206 family membrane protein n=1 Tax=Oceaniferula flava TaxID=2800421 RepID=A0AAE2SBH4_9BACT|nr:TIGR02206 family membrane protein [Oceaniferula flavus]MBK1854392.1 TIGR02206 family membrane protein [Oceaniferula flavus]MBM1135698.1 TIGR02206 family membrane protein [Oceaniferula flavus]